MCGSCFRNLATFSEIPPSCKMGGAKKDPNAPKRPLSAYFIFMGMFKQDLSNSLKSSLNLLVSNFSGEKRAEVKAANPDYKIGDIAKVIVCKKCSIECTIFANFASFSGECSFLVQRSKLGLLSLVICCPSSVPLLHIFHVAQLIGCVHLYNKLSTHCMQLFICRRWGKCGNRWTRRQRVPTRRRRRLRRRNMRRRWQLMRLEH